MQTAKKDASFCHSNHVYGFVRLLQGCRRAVSELLLLFSLSAVTRGVSGGGPTEGKCTPLWAARASPAPLDPCTMKSLGRWVDRRPLNEAWQTKGMLGMVSVDRRRRPCPRSHDPTSSPKQRCESHGQQQHEQPSPELWLLHTGLEMQEAKNKSGASLALLEQNRVMFCSVLVVWLGFTCSRSLHDCQSHQVGKYFFFSFWCGADRSAQKGFKPKTK